MGRSPFAMEGGRWGRWGSIPGEHPRAASSAPFGKQCYCLHPKQNHLLSSLSISAAPATWCGFFPLWMLGFPCCSEQTAAPALAGRQEESWLRLCSHEQFCLTSGGRIFFVKGLLVWVNNPLIVTFEVLLKLKRDDKTNVEWRYFFFLKGTTPIIL